MPVSRSIHNYRARAIICFCSLYLWQHVFLSLYNASSLFYVERIENIEAEYKYIQSQYGHNTEHQIVNYHPIFEMHIQAKVKKIKIATLCNLIPLVPSPGILRLACLQLGSRYITLIIYYLYYQSTIKSQSGTKIILDWMLYRQKTKRHFLS